MPGPPQIGNIMATLLGQVPSVFQREENPLLKIQLDKQKPRPVEGNQVLPEGFEMGPDGIPRLKRDRVDVNELDHSYFPEDDERTGSAMAVGAERASALRGLLQFEGGIDPNNPLSGSKAEILRRFGVTGEEDFDTATQAIWDYVESGKDLTRADLSGLREWLAHKRRAGAGTEDPWWRTDPFEEKISGRSASKTNPLTIFSKGVRQKEEEMQNAREMLMNHILGGWDLSAGELGRPGGIGSSRGYDWGREPEEVRERLKSLGQTGLESYRKHHPIIAPPTDPRTGYPIPRYGGY